MEDINLSQCSKSGNVIRYTLGNHKTFGMLLDLKFQHLPLLILLSKVDTHFLHFFHKDATFFTISNIRSCQKPSLDPTVLENFCQVLLRRWSNYKFRISRLSDYLHQILDWNITLRCHWSRSLMTFDHSGGT